jgi:integration host factor subunit beta
MTRSNLILALAARFPNLMVKDADIAVREILEAIGQSLANGDHVEIRGFGSFGLNCRPPRIARNPKTGETVRVAPKWVPHFKAGKEMRGNVDESARTRPLQRVA